MIKNIFKWGDLGRDFWLFRLGQAISVIGDSCGYIAMSWWVLDVTGSAAKMGSIIAPAMFVRIFLLPLFGPIGDKFPRKWIVVIGDIWRGIIYIILACLVYLKIFILPLVLALFVLLAIGSALFGSASLSIVPQLVPRDKIQKAIQQEQAIMAGGSIIGGIAGGVLTTFLGVGGAFLVDALSYFLAAMSSYLIRANTSPILGAVIQKKNAIISWFDELKEGFKVFVKIPLQFWLGIVIAMLNFFASPMNVALPVLVKDARNMPPWFLGALESSISIGSVLGAFFVGYLCRKFLTDFVIVAGVIIFGLGVIVLPWTPNLSLPMFAMFFIGIALMMANIPLNTQMTLAIPDDYRSRTNTLMNFLGQIATPIGTFFSGFLITEIGLNWTLFYCGISLVVFTPLLFLIPKFSEFFRLSPEKAATFYIENYPKAFKK